MAAGRVAIRGSPRREARVRLRAIHPTKGMRVTQVDYLAPTTPEDAARALLAGGPAARPLAGGTDLLVQLRAGRLRPGADRGPEAHAGRDRHPRGSAAASSSARRRRARRSASMRRFGRAWPGVVEAANLIGSTQVQGRASLGGNLCNASPAADSVPALVAARAICVDRGPGRAARGAGRGHRRSARARTIAASPASSCWSSACRRVRRGRPTPICADSAHRDGHRRRRRRGQPGAGRRPG